MSETPNLPDIEAMRTPEGTSVLTLTCGNLFDVPGEVKLMPQVVTGAHVFRLSMDSGKTLHFVHASPGTGTRIASLPIADFHEAQRLIVYLVWSPDAIRLHVGDEEQRIGLREVQGSPCEFQLYALTDGGVLELGGPGVAVAGARIMQADGTVHQPPAREAWHDTLVAIEVLLTGESDRGYVFENVQANAVLSMLVTGFEVYCEKRIVEIEEEGASPDLDALAAKFPKYAESKGRLEAEAIQAYITPTALLASRLNFQNYKVCKDAYSTGYGIRFVDLPDITSEDIRLLKQRIGFRHRIIHVSPLIGFLNQPEVPPEEPVFANRAQADTSIELFTKVIEALHQATLALRPP